MNRLLALILLTLLLLPTQALAELVPPDTLIRSISNEVVEIIKNDQDLQSKGEVTAAVAQIDTKVLTHFNFKHMTALAMGKEWRKATPEQQGVLVKEFKNLLVRTYSNALTVYKNPTVTFKPARFQPADTEALIRTQVQQPGSNPVDIDYHLEKLSDSWQVFDVVVAGVSLVTNYRDYFTQEVRNGGVEGAIKSLQAKNQSLAEKK